MSFKICAPIAPVIGRMAMVLAVACFPYARPEGMGKAFHAMAGKGTVAAALAVTVAVTVPWGIHALVVLACALGAALAFDHYAAKQLGGLTGDLYGAPEKLTETAVLFFFWVLLHLPQEGFF